MIEGRALLRIKNRSSPVRPPRVAPQRSAKGLAQWLWQNVDFWVYFALKPYE